VEGRGRGNGGGRERGNGGGGVGGVKRGRGEGERRVFGLHFLSVCFQVLWTCSQPVYFGCMFLFVPPEKKTFQFLFRNINAVCTYACHQNTTNKCMCRPNFKQ
jgi:hypothetical protein